MNLEITVNRFFSRSALGLVACAAVFMSHPVMAEEAQSVHRIKHEFGLWIGASNPVPGTELDQVLDSNLGGGIFYRFSWPWIFYTEFGTSYANYFSRGTQSATVVPVYGALSYPIQLPIRMQMFAKLGGGSAYVLIRPNNRSGWEPLGYAGLEFSILAGKKFRIGLRLDYNLVYEKNRSEPQQPLLPVTTGSTDPRYQRTAYFKKRNGHFFHFGLMTSFLF
ncbi:MAG: hypothetical protein JNM27_07855 [Leptospirales bacterium]|nr:hypothetical protein [Leptospirales bacterium]